MNKIDMASLGFNNHFLAESKLYPGLYVGRVFLQYNNRYKVVCEENEVVAEVSGKLRFNAETLLDYPAVGDFVMLDRNTNANGNAIIHHILSRKSVFIRKAAGTSNDCQVVASNIDTVFICMSLNNNFNLRRIERYLSIVWDSGAVPVIVLTKSDLCEDIEQKLQETASVAIGVDIVVTSGVLQEGYLPIGNYIKESQTIAFVGSSGVGKSTLINCLLGNHKMETQALSNNDKGRHTTTRRELIMLANGGIVIDTPGMRELGLESADFSKTFADIDELSAMCKFQDCTHTNEPGCAVQKAIENGIILPERFSNYQKLKKEAKYEGLNSKQIENAKIQEMFKSVGGIKQARKFAREKNSKEYR